MSKDWQLSGLWRSLRSARQKSIWARLRDQRGGSLVESAISISIFLMVFFAVFDFSIAFYTYHYISDAAREGTRYAIVRGSLCSSNSKTAPCPATADDIASYIKGLNYPGIDPANYKTISTSWLTPSGPSGSGNTFSACTTAPCNKPGYQVKVDITYQFPLDVPLWAEQTLKIRSSSAMVISQ